MYEIFSLKTNIKTSIINIDAMPPPKLNKEAVKPLVRKTKSDLKQARRTVCLFCIKNMEYIITIFESPSFTPTGRKGNTGKRLSIIESTIINESISPHNAMFFIFIKSPEYFYLSKDSKKNLYKIYVRYFLKLQNINITYNCLETLINSNLKQFFGIIKRKCRIF